MKTTANVPEIVDRNERYLRLERWAARRYSQPDGAGARLLIHRGLIASRYTVIEQLAAERYLTRQPQRRQALTYPPIFEAPTA